MDAAARGSAALSTSDYSAAIIHYTAAITTNPNAVDYYIQRSTAYTRTSPPDHTLALRDAERAVALATKRGKRELITQAQLRRGIALYVLERWGDADRVFGWVRRLDEKAKSLGIWEAKVKGKMGGLEPGDQRGVAGVKEVPEETVPDDGTPSMVNGENGVDKNSVKKEQDGERKDSGGVQTPANKIRHEWYQTGDSVVVTLLAKGVPKDTTAVDIQKHSMSISFPLPGGTDFDFSLDPLFAPIDDTASSFKIMSTKVEFILRKVTPGQKWSSLEGSQTVVAGDAERTTETASHIKGAVVNSTNANSVPSYPTSSKSGPKNWDKLAANLTKKPKEPTPNTDHTPNGTDTAASPTTTQDDDLLIDEDEDDGAPENAFFKKLFAGADPDTRRAMMKSYQESNGTALSTNWEDVKKGPVETSPPDGMVARRWGE